MRSIKKYAAVAMTVSALAMTAACGDDADTAAPASNDTTSETPTDEMTEDTMDPARDLVGPGCGDYAAAVPDGEGSVEGMAADPVATAASNNPLLKTLVASVSGQLNPKVNLVDTLNGGEFTVFAPTDEAFAKIDKKTINTLKKDADLLTTILTYHVVEGQITPDQIAGEQTTLQGGTVEVTGEGDNLKVNDASVICGGVHTANATVYLIDSVLLPAS